MANSFCEPITVFAYFMTFYVRQICKYCNWFVFAYFMAFLCMADMYTYLGSRKHHNCASVGKYALN